jgi:hypothetical protein
MVKLVTWDDDGAIAHDPLRMRITNQTLPMTTQTNFAQTLHR